MAPFRLSCTHLCSPALSLSPAAALHCHGPQRMRLDILYQDEHLVAIQKPHGLLVHHSPLAADATEACVQTLRDQIGQKVYPVHRLDRQTGGVLLFALDPNINSLMQQQFMNYDIQKTYLALVRGFTEDKGSVDKALKTEKGHVQEALTHYTTLKRFEVPIAVGKFSSSRYSLVEVKPKTGRTHQIRRHFTHISHPIIGDRRHGCNRQNNLFRDNALLGIGTMFLHASALTFIHPITEVEVAVQAELQEPFQQILEKLGAMSASDIAYIPPPPSPSLPLAGNDDTGDTYCDTANVPKKNQKNGHDTTETETTVGAPCHVVDDNISTTTSAEESTTKEPNEISEALQSQLSKRQKIIGI